MFKSRKVKDWCRHMLQKHFWNVVDGSRRLRCVCRYTLQKHFWNAVDQEGRGLVSVFATKQFWNVVDQEDQGVVSILLSVAPTEAKTLFCNLNS